MYPRESKPSGNSLKTGFLYDQVPFKTGFTLLSLFNKLPRLNNVNNFSNWIENFYKEAIREIFHGTKSHT